MKLGKRALKGIIIATMLLGYSTATYGLVLHEETKTQTITKGATLIQDKVLTDEGWRYINTLKVNLSEENVSLKPIESSTGVTRQTILQMVNDSGAIAGINADFFDIASNNSPSFGAVIEDGELKHAYNSNYSSLGPNKYMATFLLDESNEADMAYYGVSLRINADGALVGALAGYNILPTTLTRPIVIDQTYLKTTNNAISKWQATYAIVVEDEVVTYQSKADEVVNIPENGYVILIPSASANEYYSKLPIGKAVQLQQYLYLESGVTNAIEEMQMGIGGGGLIMKNGEAYTGSSHKITPTSKDPRTVIATLKHSNEVLLIAIDGRGTYKGMTHSDLVSYLKDKGVKDAMYFDGGGSTTLVSRNEGEAKVEVQNNPSDGSSRKVVNGIGVFTNSTTGSLASLLMESTYDRGFVGESLGFSFKGLDENSNPVTLDSSQVKLVVTGVAAEVNGTRIRPTSAGKAVVTASYNGVSVSKEMVISEAPVGLRIEPSVLPMEISSTKNIQVYGIDSEGYQLPISAAKLTWTSSHGNVSAKELTVSATGKAVATLTADYKGAKASLGVTVGDLTTAIESFETHGGNWGGDTSSVVGKVEHSLATHYEGQKSLKMTYTFSKSTNKQVAYTLFSEPITVPKDAISINLWAYANKQGHVAKLEVVDANERKFFLKLSDSLNFEGWKYLSVNLPEDMVLPAKITKFYTYANTMDEKLTTSVFLDHVSITRGAKTSVRTDYLYDPWYKEELQGPTSTQSIINAVGATKINSMTLSSEAIQTVSSNLSKDANAIIFATNSNLALNVAAAQSTYKNTYQVNDYENTRVIMVPTGSGGIRTTDTGAWLNVKSAIEKSSSKNIILVMSKNPLTQFTDAEEGLAFHRYLVSQREASGKNIFVIYPGGISQEARIEDGIRYLRTNGLNTVTDYIGDGTYIQFKMDGDEVYYTFKKFGQEK